MPNNFIKHFRREYLVGEIDESELLEDPYHQFMEWLEDATRSGIDDPNAMSLATVSPDGRPSVRTVLLKDARKEGYVFVSNYQSRKGHELSKNQYASVSFFWPGLSEDLFSTMPLESRIAAIISPQSEVIESRVLLEEKFQHYKKLFNDQNLKRPDFWGGYILKPDYYEFWQGRENRLNDRISYIIEGDNWKMQRLAP